MITPQKGTSQYHIKIPLLSKLRIQLVGGKPFGYLQRVVNLTLGSNPLTVVRVENKSSGSSPSREQIHRQLFGSQSASNSLAVVLVGDKSIDSSPSGGQIHCIAVVPVGCKSIDSCPSRRQIQYSSPSWVQIQYSSPRLGLEHGISAFKSLTLTTGSHSL